MLNFKNGLPQWFSLMSTFQIYDALIDMYCRGFRIATILLFMDADILFCFVRKVCHVTSTYFNLSQVYN